MTPVCCLCGLLTSAMDSLAIWPSYSVIRERTSAFVTIRSLFRQRVYQIVAGYEDANDADRLRHDPASDPRRSTAGTSPGLTAHPQPLGERALRPRLRALNEALLDWFVRLCGHQVRQRGEILLDVDSTDDPTHGQQQLSFFNGAYNQHMYHPLLIFERHTGCLLAARLRRAPPPVMPASCPCCCAWCRDYEAAFPGVKIKLRADAGFALPLLYEFCEFFGIQYAIGIPANCVFKQRADPRQKQLQRRYRRTQQPQRCFSSFRIGPALGRISAASATKPNTPKPAPTCASW